MYFMYYIYILFFTLFQYILIHFTYFCITLHYAPLACAIEISYICTINYALCNSDLFFKTQHFLPFAGIFNHKFSTEAAFDYAAHH